MIDIKDETIILTLSPIKIEKEGRWGGRTSQYALGFLVGGGLFPGISATPILGGHYKLNYGIYSVDFFV